jgi:hypothetical protein
MSTTDREPFAQRASKLYMRTLLYLRRPSEGTALDLTERFYQLLEETMATDREHEALIGQKIGEVETAVTAARDRILAAAEEITQVIADLEAKIAAERLDRIDSADEVARLEAVKASIGGLGAPAEPPATEPAGNPV